MVGLAELDPPYFKSAALIHSSSNNAGNWQDGLASRISFIRAALAYRPFPRN